MAEARMQNPTNPVLLQVKGCTVADPNGDKIGKVDDLFTGRDRQPRYLGVKMGFLGTKMTFIPIQLVTNVDPTDKSVTVAVTKELAKDGPVFDRDHEFTSQDEAAVWNYYGLGEPAYVMTEMLLWEEAS
jgi:hypothetical protein